MEIPHIIHQIWVSDSIPLPQIFIDMSNTWKRDYPSWEYKFWGKKEIDNFLKDNFPEFVDIFYKFPFDIQRLDAIRYLILYKIGGMYVDVDYESISNMSELFINKTCCFALEPKSHIYSLPKLYEKVFNNALMLSVPGHPFMKKIIEKVFSRKTLSHETSNKDLCVMETTGPWMLVDMFYKMPKCEKDRVFLIPSEFVSPLDFWQISSFIEGNRTHELESYIEKAYAVHYFFGMWKEK